MISVHLVAKHILKVSPIRQFLSSIFHISFSEHAFLSSHFSNRVLLR